MHDFVLKGLISAIGVQSDYWVILESAKWFEKGILLEEDLIEIQRLIDEKNIPVEEPNNEETMEELVDEKTIEEPIEEEE